MLGEYDFHLSQLQFLKSAMDQLPTFGPLAMTPAQVQLEYDGAISVRTAFLSKSAAVNLGRGELYEILAEAHQVAIGVYGVMKTRYRKDPGSLAAILKLPTQDQTFQQTRERSETISILWGQLPNDTHLTPPGPFVAWPGMTKIAFDAILAALLAAQSAFVAASEDFEMAQGDLHIKDAHVADLVVAALGEGRAQFSNGTAEREVIDSIPTALAAQSPNQAIISVPTSPAAGQVHLEFDALHGTSFDVLHKGPGEIEFTTVADDTINKTFDASGLVPGDHEYKVIGQNSRGNGPESEAVTIAVA